VALSAPYPNPSLDAETAVRFDLTSACPQAVTWKIVTVANRLLAQGSLTVMGKATVAWDQRDSRGRLVADGVYYFRLTQEGQPDRRAKILILR